MHRILLLASMTGWSAFGAGPAAVAPEAKPPAPPPAPTAAADASHEVVHANTLWDLAQRYCKDPWQWPRIYEANKGQIKNPHWIYPGQVFRIPCVGKTVTVYPKAPEPVPAAAPAPEPEPQPEPPPPAPAPKEAGAPEMPTESLSTRLPQGLTEHSVSMERLQLPSGWTADGGVTEFEGHEVLAAQGDTIRVRLAAPGGAAKGQRFEVFRRGAPTEDDVDQDARYAQKIGVVELVRPLGGAEFAAVIIRSGTTLQIGDMLKRKDPAAGPRR